MNKECLSNSRVMNGEGSYPVNLIYSKDAANRNTDSFFRTENALIIFSPRTNNRMELKTISHIVLGNLIENRLKSFLSPRLQIDKSLMEEFLGIYPIMSKLKIWLFIDSPNTASGNAELLFNFCPKIDDKIEKYFVIDKNTTDAIRIEFVGTVIQYGSSTYKLLHLYVEKIISSNTMQYNVL